MTLTTNTFVIKDTGYLTIDQSGTQETYRANGGTEILLYVKSSVFNINANHDSKPSPGVTGHTDANNIGIFTSDFVSMDNPALVLNCYYDINDATQLAYLKALAYATRTRGIKEYYYKHNLVGEYANRRKNLLDVFGVTDVQNSVYAHLHVRINQIQIPETADKTGRIHFQVTLEVLG
jgi:hypothetical protein